MTFVMLDRNSTLDGSMLVENIYSSVSCLFLGQDLSY